MAIVSFRKAYDERIGEMEAALRDAHTRMGEYISTCMAEGKMADLRVRIVYDNLLLLSNTLNEVKGFGPCIRFSDEEKPIHQH